MSLKAGSVVLLVGGLLAFAAGWSFRPIPPPPQPPLPDVKLVPVEVVKEIEVPGPERVVEVIRWRTETVEVPTEVVKVVREIVTTGRPIVGDVSIEARKYEGTDDDGKLVQGWDGLARCEIAEVQDDSSLGPWVEIVSKGFDLSRSTAVSVVPPAAHLPAWVTAPRRTELRLGITTDAALEVGISRYGARRLGWWVSVAADRDVTQSTQAAGGVAWTFGRR